MAEAKIISGRTKREVVIEQWREHGRVVVPKGTPVSNRTAREPTEGDWFFVDSFEFLDQWLRHDAEYRGIRIDAEDVEIMDIETLVPR